MPFPSLSSAVKLGGFAAAFALTIGSYSSQAIEVSEIAKTPPSCPPGDVVEVVFLACIPAAPGAVSDSVFAEYAISLARFERAEEGLTLLGNVANTEQARVQNALGFVKRTLGDAEGALPHYLKAIELDPDYHPARSYLGEAYIMLGDLDKAREQLTEIGNRCGVSCEPYTVLEAALATPPANKPAW